jgi:hypothetical protein
MAGRSFGKMDSMQQRNMTDRKLVGKKIGVFVITGSPISGKHSGKQRARKKYPCICTKCGEKCWMEPYRMKSNTCCKACKQKIDVCGVRMSVDEACELFGVKKATYHERKSRMPVMKALTEPVKESFCENSGKKICTKCKSNLPIEEFHKNGSGKRTAMCRSCRSKTRPKQGKTAKLERKQKKA